MLAVYRITVTCHEINWNNYTNYAQSFFVRSEFHFIEWKLSGLFTLKTGHSYWYYCCIYWTDWTRLGRTDWEDYQHGSFSCEEGRKGSRDSQDFTWHWLFGIVIKPGCRALTQSHRKSNKPEVDWLVKLLTLSTAELGLIIVKMHK